MLESELFGHIRGAFTDAKSDKIGLFEKADGGTIFLDEIDKTHARTFQERLLRVVDQGEIKPVGANQARKIDVRIHLCAANRSLKDLVESGDLPEGSLLPSTRDRDRDPAASRTEGRRSTLLAEHFLEHFTETELQAHRRASRTRR